MTRAVASMPPSQSISARVTATGSSPVTKRVVTVG